MFVSTQSAIVLPLVLCFIAYVTHLDFNPNPVKVPLPDFKGPLAYNELLDSAERLLEGKIHGPESLAVFNGDIYTGVSTGEIVRISNENQISTVAKIGQKCEGYWESRMCGRPLGVRFSKNGKLYVADAVYGIHSVDVKTGIVIPLLTTYRTIEDRTMVFPDDISIDDDGIIYISDASGRWDVNHLLFCSGEFDNTGRVIRFDPKTNEATVIMKNIYFPNGVQVSPKGDFLLVSEISKRRILRYYLKGNMKGKSDVFIDKLPGEPDNIRLSSKGGYWVAMATARNSTHTLFTDFLIEHPFLLKYTTKFLYSIGSVLEQMARLLPYPAIREFAYQVKYGFIGITISNTPAMIIELSADGKILRNLYSTGKNAIPSEVLEHNGYLYIGSFVNKYLGKVKL